MSIVIVSPPRLLARGAIPFSVVDPAVAALVAFLRRYGVPAIGYLTDGDAGADDADHFLADVTTLVLEHDVAVVGISLSYLPSVAPAVRLAQELRSRFPALTLVAGGGVSTGLMMENLHRSVLNDFDLVVPGDGEAHLLSIVTGETPASQPLRRDTPANALELLAVEGLTGRGSVPGQPQEFAAWYRRVRPSLHIVTSRSCPFSCPFCISPAMGVFRAVSPSAVGRAVDELLLLGLGKFTFDSNNFNLPHREFAATMAQLSRLGARFDAMARTGSLRSDDLARFATAGGYLLYFGVETLSPAVQRAIGKSADLGLLCREADLCHCHNVAVAFNLILGLPGSSEAEDRETLRLAEWLVNGGHADLLCVSVYTPLPGTEFWRSPLMRVVDNDWTRWDADHAVADTRPLIDAPWYSTDRIAEVYRDFRSAGLPLQLTPQVPIDISLL